MRYLRHPVQDWSIVRLKNGSCNYDKCSESFVLRVGMVEGDLWWEEGS